MMNQHVCRCCLLENPVVTYNIFEDNLRFELLQCVPGVNVEPEDGLPEVICDHCRTRINETLEFRRRCEESDRELRRLFDDTNRAIEQALGLGVLDSISQDDGDSIILANLDVEPKQTEGILEPHEMTMLNELLRGDFTLNSLPDAYQSIRSQDEDPIITELLNKVLNEPSFENNTESLLSSEACSDLANMNNNNNIYEMHSHPNTDQENYQNPHLSEEPTVPLAAAAAATATVKKSPKSLHPCSECEKKFTRNFQLKLHMISVHNLGDGLQYKCDEKTCLKTFASRHSLNYHRKSTHSQERPYACSQCQRRFVLRTQLSSHMRVHTGESKPRIHMCTQCDKSFLTKSDLRTHLRSHDPVQQQTRPYKCDLCEKSFFTRGHLSSHALVHTGEKPYVCAFCEKSYQGVGNLNNHMVRNHADVLVGNPHNQGLPLEA